LTPTGTFRTAADGSPGPAGWKIAGVVMVTVTTVAPPKRASLHDRQVIPVSGSAAAGQGACAATAGRAALSAATTVSAAITSATAPRRARRTTSAVAVGDFMPMSPSRASWTRTNVPTGQPVVVPPRFDIAGIPAR
jgi:hypothetical protein